MREDARQRATEFVKELYATGEIDADRFGAGVAGVLAAGSEAELAEVVRSLPAPVALTSQERRLAEPLEIHSGLGRLRLAGRWQVASQTHISADLGSIRLDLTEAEFDDHIVDLHVYTGWGSITIIVPPGRGRSGDAPPGRGRLAARSAGARAAAGPARRDHQYRPGSPTPPGNPGPPQTLARRQQAPIDIGRRVAESGHGRVGVTSVRSIGRSRIFSYSSSGNRPDCSSAAIASTFACGAA
jgi:hypothetical protein